MPAPHSISRRTACAAVAGSGALVALSACKDQHSPDTTQKGARALLRIGTMATEDFLPGWVAQEQGFFSQEGLDAKIVVFQSAQELTAACTAAEIDAALTDPQVSATLSAGGTPVALQWIALGAAPDQGRFGIQTNDKSGIATLADLRGKRIGVGSNTVPEYVMDKLLEAAGMTSADITKEEIKKIPVRFEMMASGQIEAAALPASLLALGETKGYLTVADDTSGDNLSQSVLVARTEVLDTDDGTKAIKALRRAWNRAVRQINSSPNDYRALLAKNTNLPAPLATSYPVATYPLDARATAAMIQPQLDWMVSKGYLKEPLDFNEATGTFQAVGN